MLVHLLRQLAGQLHRLDVRAKRPAEHTLDEAFDLALDGAENAHGRCFEEELRPPQSGGCALG